MIITTEKSKWPTLSVGIFWFLYCLLFPLYRLKDYFVVGILSIVLYIILDRLLTKRVDLTSQIQKTGISAIDKEIAENLAVVYQLEDKVHGLAIEDKVKSIIAISTSIYEYISEHPKQVNQINTFTAYYMPMVEKLIDSYVDFENKETKTASMVETQEKIISTLDVVAKAFTALLEDLYQNKVLDVKTDLVVFERMVASEGLTKGLAGELKPSYSPQEPSLPRTEIEQSPITDSLADLDTKKEGPDEK